jgi:hypothetical protein
VICLTPKVNFSSDTPAIEVSDITEDTK